jgi:hypothetical protein
LVPPRSALRLQRVPLDKRTDMSARKGNKFAKKRPGERKDKCFQVRVRPGEHMAWKGLSASLGMTLSDWVREVLNWSSGEMVKHNRLEHVLRRMGSHRRRNFLYLSGEKRQPKKGRKPEPKTKVY